MTRGRVFRFEVADPSLEAIFISLVGRPADDGESTLAQDARPTDSDADVDGARRRSSMAERGI